MGEKGRYKNHTTQPVLKQMARLSAGKTQILLFLMPGSKYIILVVLLINERNKERKKEREGRRKEEKKKIKRRGRREKSEKEKNTQNAALEDKRVR